MQRPGDGGYGTRRPEWLKKPHEGDVGGRRAEDRAGEAAEPPWGTCCERSRAGWHAQHSVVHAVRGGGQDRTRGRRHGGSRVEGLLGIWGSGFGTPGGEARLSKAWRS